MAIWYIILPIGKFYGHLVYFVVIWYLFPRFGMLYPEKSGNPDMDLSKKMKWNYRRILDLFVWPVLWHLTLAANPHRQLTSGMFVVFQVYSQKTAFDSK
jgi:hypothetical protein